MEFPCIPKRILIFTGHYGSGKTTISAAAAFALAASGKEVTIVDLDIVNPYFRTADFKALFESRGIRCISPVHANSNLETVMLSPAVDAALRQHSGYVVIDVGGDDAGAVVLGRYTSLIAQQPYDMFYVVNAYRFLTQSPVQAAELLSDIEAASHLDATHIVANPNIGASTSPDDVDNAYSFAVNTSRCLSLPLAFTCAVKGIAPLCKTRPIFPVSRLVKPVWESET